MSERVYVFDTTLRDGEQAAGSRLGVGEKLAIAHQLARLGVDVIEAGFPCSSPADFDAVKTICEAVQGPTICGLTRAVMKDIDVCGQALENASRGRIHTGIGVSDIHVLGKFGDPKYGDTIEAKRDTLITMATKAVRRCREFVDDVEFYAEDAGRADRDFLFNILAAVVEAGATVLNIPDTTGYAVPEQYGALIGDIRKQVPNIDRATISVHCHDDLGMAVANSLAGVRNGARQVEGTINGIGERAGNAALEEVVMGLKTRADYFGVDTGIHTREFYKTSRMVADAMDMPVPANKAVIGGNAFSHSSGIHVDGVLKDRHTYEIMLPADVGVPEGTIVLTARTGRHGVQHRLAELGHKFEGDALDQIYQRFLRVADKKKAVEDEDLIAIVGDEIHTVPVHYRLLSVRTATGEERDARATVEIGVGDDVVSADGRGDGPVDAAYKALVAASGTEATLVGYRLQAATSGAEAMGEASVRLKHAETVVVGRGASTDVIEASVKAYVDGLNRLAATESGADTGPAPHEP